MNLWLFFWVSFVMSDRWPDTGSKVCAVDAFVLLKPSSLYILQIAYRPSRNEPENFHEAAIFANRLTLLLIPVDLDKLRRHEGAVNCCYWLDHRYSKFVISGL